MGTTKVFRKNLNFTEKFHKIPNFVYTKKYILGTFILHLLNCINFMKIDEKSIVELQISMNLVQ